MSHESGGAPEAALAPIPDCDCGSLWASDERLAEYINTRPDAESDGVFPEQTRGQGSIKNYETWHKHNVLSQARSMNIFEG